MLINKYQKLYSEYKRSPENRRRMLKIQIKKVEEQLFPIFFDLQSMIINSKVLRKSNKSVGGTSIIEGKQDIFEDLTLHQVQQMYQYLPKIDTSRKVFSILQKIQNISSQVHFHKYYQSNDILINDNNDEENETDLSKIDRLYFLNNPHQYEVDELKLIYEQLGIENPLKKDKTIKNKLDTSIFGLMESIIRFQYIKNSKGMLNKLHVINTCLYERLNEFNNDFYKLKEVILKNRKYNVKLDIFKGLIKTVKIMVNDYVKNDPNIQIGNKQIEYYVSLLLYVMIVFGYFDIDKLNEQELEKVKNQKKLFDLKSLKISNLFDGTEISNKIFNYFDILERSEI